MKEMQYILNISYIKQINSKNPSAEAEGFYYFSNFITPKHSGLWNVKGSPFTRFQER